MYLLNVTSAFHIPSPTGTYVYDIVPISASSALAAISSDDCLRILDSSTLQVKSLIKNSGKEVTCLKSFGGEGDSVIAVGGRDGKVGLWDFRLGSGSKVGEVRSGEFVLLFVRIRRNSRSEKSSDRR